MSQTLLEATDLAIFRGEHCLFAKLSLAVGSGQVLQVSGDNGSGKTTLLRGLCTFVPLEAGAVAWRGTTLPDKRDLFYSELTYLGQNLTPRRPLIPDRLLVSASRLSVAGESNTT